MQGSLLADRLMGACRRYAARIAITDDVTRFTFHEMLDAASDAARALERAGCEPSEPVLVAVSNRASDLVGYFAVWMLGAVVVPVHRRAAVRTMDRVRSTTCARFLLDLERDERLTRIADESAPDPMLDQAAWVVFTSGSTGEPKGVVHGQDRYAAKLDMIEGMVSFGDGGVTLLVLQLTFSFGQWVSLLSLLTGGTLIVHERFDVERTVRALEGVTRAAFVPTMLRLMQPMIATGRARGYGGTLLLGGEPLPAPLARSVLSAWPDARLRDIYGLTETATSDFFVAPEEYPEAAGSIGSPGEGIRYRLAAADGELQIRSPFAMRGYLGARELTEAAFDDGWFRTGDLARVRDDARVELVGRRKEVINRGGHKISPLEVEATYLEHPDVDGALVAGAPDPLVGESVHLLVVPRPDSAIDADALLAWGAQRLDGYKRPDAVHFRSELPTGSTGKADRSAIRRLIEDASEEERVRDESRD